MKRPLAVIAGLIAVSLVVGLAATRPVAAQGGPPQRPPGPRWQVCHAEVSFSEKKEDVARNTILLDTETGDTYLMWTSGEEGKPPYHWVRMTREEQ